ncbi:peptidase inhibitor family I36 protein [Streptomyces pseudovenezuelae]|uniref:peptidase inhibitor family I36 protein n=1 Tax=Streptomyces pseudovenezuelae TaxID=67350 RepID=UPI0036E77053
MKAGFRRKAGLGVAALLMTTATVVASAPAASAAQEDCPRGYVCVWNNDVAWGQPTWKSTGNLYDLHSNQGMTIVNNGVPWPGADHIWIDVTAPGGNVRECLHYPGDLNASHFVGSVTLHSAVWGGEC